MVNYAQHDACKKHDEEEHSLFHSRETEAIGRGQMRTAASKSLG